jgi:hypothetical protein
VLIEDFDRIEDAPADRRRGGGISCLKPFDDAEKVVLAGSVQRIVVTDWLR